MPPPRARPHRMRTPRKWAPSPSQHTVDCPPRVAHVLCVWHVVPFICEGVRATARVSEPNVRTVYGVYGRHSTKHVWGSTKHAWAEHGSRSRQHRPGQRDRVRDAGSIFPDFPDFPRFPPISPLFLAATCRGPYRLGEQALKGLETTMASDCKHNQHCASIWK